MFVDYIKIRIKAGDGGDGSRSFRREKFVPDGGPDGGDGGTGGDVYFVATKNKNTLNSFKPNKLYKAEDGKNGQGKRMYGKSGDDLIIEVPIGTSVLDSEGNEMADIYKENEKVLIAKGGKGGLGNVHFKTSTRRAPNFATAGEKIEEQEITLELKMIADVGLLGYPNAGKSTFLSRATKAVPKIGDYPFTTLVPSLGVATDRHGRTFVIADIPGIIEGASEGVGLGLKFLRHIERCKVLLHMIDSTGMEEDPIERYEVLKKELEAYGKSTSEKLVIMCINKIDVGIEEYIPKLMEVAKRDNVDVFKISAATGQGLEELKEFIANKLEIIAKEEEAALLEKEKEEKTAEKLYTIEPKVYRGGEDSDLKIYVGKEGKDKVFYIKGRRIEGLMHRINVDDNESMHYFHRILREMGAAAKLKELGIKEGDTVNILDYYFEWYE